MHATSIQAAPDEGAVQGVLFPMLPAASGDVWVSEHVGTNPRQVACATKCLGPRAHNVCVYEQAEVPSSLFKLKYEGCL